MTEKQINNSTVGISTLTVGAGVTQAVPAGTVLPGVGSTSVLDGYFKGIVTEVDGTTIGVKFVSHVSAAGIETFKRLSTRWSL